MIGLYNVRNALCKICGELHKMRGEMKKMSLVHPKMQLVQICIRAPK